MIKNQYRRKLSRTEAKRHFVYVERKFVELFPRSEKTFTVLIGKDKLEVRVDNKSRMWSAIFWDLLPHFNEGDTVIFSQNQDGSFSVSIEK